MTNTLIFRDNDGVGGPPTIDGFFDLDLLATGDSPDSGYINGAQLTMGDAGIAPVVVKAVRDRTNDRLVMAFMVRFSASFDEDNAIVIVLKPEHSGTNPSLLRKIVLKPMRNGVGASTGVGVGDHEIKTNQDPNEIDFYKGNGSGWDPLGSTMPGVEVKVRSWIHSGNGMPGDPAFIPDEFAWSVELTLPITADPMSDWIDLSADFGLYFGVIKILPIDDDPNDGIIPPAAEYIFPTDSSWMAGTSLILFTPSDSDFGHGLIPHLDPTVTAASNGVHFVDGWQSIGRRPVGSSTLVLDGFIEGPSGTHDNELVAHIENTGSDPANDITAEFRFRKFGLASGTPITWDKPSGLTPNPAPNRLATPPDAPVDLGTTPTTNRATITAQMPRSAVTGDYVTHPHRCMWVQLNSSTPVYFDQSSIRRNMNFVDLSEVEFEPEISGEGYEEPADGGGLHEFVLQTFCRRIVVRELIEAGDKAGEDAVTLARNSLIHSRLIKTRDDVNVNDAVTARRSTAAVVADPQQLQDSVIHIWLTEGLRETGRSVTIGSKEYRVMDSGAGCFGFVAHHVGVNDPFGWEFSGSGIGRYRPGIYGVAVPHGGALSVKLRAFAQRGAKAGDQSGDLPRLKHLGDIKKQVGGETGTARPGGKPEGGCFGLVLAMLAMPAAVAGALHGLGIV